MNREVIYRGFTEDGNWVYGYYNHGNEHEIIEHGKVAIRVIPESVGQYIDMDFNGEKIWEGDRFGYEGDPSKFTVVWDKRVAGFGMRYDGWDADEIARIHPYTFDNEHVVKLNETTYETP